MTPTPVLNVEHARACSLQPQVRLLWIELRLAAFDAYGILLFLASAARSYAEQQRLYDQGRTTPRGPIVTHAQPGESWHNFGLAFDVAIRPKSDFYSLEWEIPVAIGSLGECMGLEWGGRWRRPDENHFQATGRITLAQARTQWPAGYRMD